MSVTLDTPVSQPVSQSSSPDQNDLAIFGVADDATFAQARDVRSRALCVALMADNHLGYIMPIGGVAAYDNQISVAGVGFDIACGNAAIQTDLRYDASTRRVNGHALDTLADEIAAMLSFGVGRKNLSSDAPVNATLFASDAWSAVPRHAREGLREKAREQLGTVGSGNHYVDLFADETGVVWVGVHFGSRGLGHTIASGTMALASGRQWGDRGAEVEALLGLDSALGQSYWALMTLAGEYAYTGREWVARKVVALLGGAEVALVHNHHNYAWRETHDLGAGEREVIVVRKGATPAFPGQRGFVGGSMGDNAVILRGATEADLAADTLADTQNAQRAALYSTVHGAGRVMSRTAAKGKTRYNKATGERTVIQPARVTPDMQAEWLARLGVVLRGGDVDESPHAYKRLPDVLAAQGQTVVIEHTLTPLIVCMAGRNEVDPYKD